MAWDIGADEWSTYEFPVVYPRTTSHGHTAQTVTLNAVTNPPGWDIGADEWDGAEAPVVKVISETVRT